MSFLINITKEKILKHSHKNHEIIFCTGGSALLHLPNKDIKLAPGRFVVVPPGVEHYSAKLSDDYERMFINGDFEQVFYMTEAVVTDDNSLKEGATLANMIYNNRHANCNYLSSLVNALTHFLLQNIKMKNELFTAVQNIEELINNDFHNCNISLCSVLKASGYAEDYIRSQFKVVTGKTPTEFLNETRIKHACYLIDVYKDVLSLSGIAERCGYTDYVYFSRKFKEIAGVPPRKYGEGNAEST